MNLPGEDAQFQSLPQRPLLFLRHASHGSVAFFCHSDEFVRLHTKKSTLLFTCCQGLFSLRQNNMLPTYGLEVFGDMAGHLKPITAEYDLEAISDLQGKELLSHAVPAKLAMRDSIQDISQSSFDSEDEINATLLSSAHLLLKAGIARSHCAE